MAPAAISEGADGVVGHTNHRIASRRDPGVTGRRLAVP